MGDDSGKIAYTKVIQNVETHGVVDFTEIQMEDGYAFNATREHIVAVSRPGGLEIEQAHNIQIGDIMVTSESHAKVSSVRSFEKMSKWTLGTAAGSVLVNGVWMSSICDDMFALLPIQFSAALKVWRENHEQVLL